MRIGFCGASGTGKTTLAKAIAEQRGLPLNPVGSRSVAAAMGFASPYDVDAAGKRAEFQQRLLTEKMQWEAERDSFVTDRTTLDNLAYTVLHDVHSIDRVNIEAAQVGVDRYTHIVLCPVSSFIRLSEDPLRVLHAEYHEIYDALLQGLLRAYATNRYVLVLRGLPDLDDRLAVLGMHLDNILTKFATFVDRSP